MSGLRSARENRRRGRWLLAGLLNRLPWMCWANLVSYALGDRRWPWQPVDAVCRADIERRGACYCGKVPARPATAPGPQDTDARAGGGHEPYRETAVSTGDDDVRLLLRRLTAERDQARRIAVALEQDGAHTAERLQAALALVLDRLRHGWTTIGIRDLLHALSGQEPTT
jgi:hypothetical protein